MVDAGPPGENPADGSGCDTNDGWITGNIVFDRDVFGPGDHGDFGVSLKNGRVAFGVGFGTDGNTICGATDVADDVWHHVAVTRRRSDGWLRVYVDGLLDAEGPGNVGATRNVSYRDDRTTSYPDSDPFLVIGAEKHDAGAQFPSYSGWIDEVRLSAVQRYTGSAFPRPVSRFTPDATTAALYHLDEGADDFVGDASGGNSHGTRMFGGSPAGPEWSTDGAPLDAVPPTALERVVEDAGRTVAIANAGDGRLFVVDANGRILAYQVTPTGPFTFLGVFLDIQDRVLCCGERGLLGLAFHPAYATNRYFYVYYTSEPVGHIVIARYQAPTAASNSGVDPSTERILLTIPHSTHANHNGGGLAFGPPPDSYLYAAVGDGGGGGDPFQSGQSRETFLGKVLRFDVDVDGGPAPYYTVPPSNPFVGLPAPVKPEIWAWGLRNPWRIAFDRLTGDLLIADVGQESREEVNFQPAGSDGGENYGWRRMEGTACFDPATGCQTGGLVLPVLEYGHGEGCSITGGYRYRGSQIPGLGGAYLFGDFCSGKIWIGIEAPGESWARYTLLHTGLSISSFGEDSQGELYVAHVGGDIYRLGPAPTQLTVTRTGSGTGTVSDGGDLDCGAACDVEYAPGEIVTLTAAAAASSWFTGWSGACGGTGNCVVPMDGDRVVTATFTIRPALEFSASSYSVNESAGNATITVRRLANTAGTVTVDYSIAGGTADAAACGRRRLRGPRRLAHRHAHVPAQARRAALSRSRSSTTTTPKARRRSCSRSRVRARRGARCSAPSRRPC